MQTGGKRRSLTKLGTILAGAAGFVPLGRLYFVRELLLFVALAVLLVFLAANVALLGILVHAAVQAMFRSVRKGKPGIAPWEGGPVASHADAFAGPATIGTTARIGSS
jgi:hypothetical protein